jgi:hypothetical protein
LYTPDYFLDKIQKEGIYILVLMRSVWVQVQNLKKNPSQGTSVTSLQWGMVIKFVFLILLRPACHVLVKERERERDMQACRKAEERAFSFVHCLNQLGQLRN